MILNSRSLALPTEVVENCLYLGSTLNFITPGSYKGGHALRVESTSPSCPKRDVVCSHIASFYWRILRMYVVGYRAD